LGVGNETPKIVAGMNRGEEPKRELYLQAYDLLVSTNRETSGDGYRRLVDAFERLAGTRITTNIRTNDEQIRGLIRIRVNFCKLSSSQESRKEAG